MNFGITELLVILAIAAVLFGTRKLRSLGGDLGGALRGFRKALNEDEGNAAMPPSADSDKAEEKRQAEAREKDPDS